MIDGDEGSPIFLPTPFSGAEFIFDETSRVTGDYRGAIDILLSMYARDESDDSDSRSSHTTGPSTFSFAGEIASMWGYGIEHCGDFNGSMVQSGLIQTGYNGISVFENSGTITSYEGSSLYFEGQFDGPFTNSGALSYRSSNAVYFDHLFTGDFLNTGNIKANTYLDRPRSRDSEEEEGGRIFFEAAPKGDYDEEEDYRDEPAAVNFRGVLNALGDLDENELKQAAGNASGQNVAAAADNYVRSQGSEVFSLFSADFSSLRTGGGSNSGVASNERNGLFTREIQVGVTVNEPIDESHAFITGYMGRGTQDPDENRTESTIDSTSIMFGRSEALSDQWRVGLWGGYTDNDVNVDGFGSTLESEAGLVGASVQYQGDYGFSNLVVGYGFHNQTNIRRDFLGHQMNGNTDGHQGLVHGQFGRDFYFGEESRLQVSPYLGFAPSRLKMGAYTEEGPAAAALRFGSQTIDSVQSAVGVNISQQYETRKGWIKPKVDAVWWHEFGEADSLGVSLAAPGLMNSFQVESEVANRRRAVVQIRMEMGFDQWENITFDASYYGTYGEDGYTAHGGALSAEFRF